MPTTFTKNDIELLGYSDPRERPVHDQAPYTIFEAIAVAGLEQITTRFIYLKSTCTLNQARAARRESDPIPHHTYLIKPASLRLSNTRLNELFDGAVSIREHEELIWNKLKTVFAQYLESLSEVPVETYFVSPRSPDREIGENLEETLFDYMKGGRQKDNGTLLVLSAPAGVGKTTLSRYLIHSLSQQVARVKTIPIYVEAQHWGKLHLESIDELWDVIDNSLRVFSSGLSLREELFFHALRQGYISFVFDGFDELCGHKNSPLDAVVVLQQLTNIAAKSEARILVTTRTLYWATEIETPPENVRVVELDSFNTQQAKGYFSKYFRTSPRRRTQATQLYSDLLAPTFQPRDSGGARSQFVNLPLCVAMVAAYVRHGGGPISADSRRDLLESVLLSICAREQERKNLNTTPERQLLSFQEIAILDEENMNPRFDFELLEATEFEKGDVRKVLDHPFLQSIDGRVYGFSYDFLGPYFRALFLARVLRTSSEELHRLSGVMAREADGKGYVAEQLSALLGPEMIQSVGSAARRISQKSPEAGSFLVHICKNLVDEDSSIVTNSERSRVLFEAIGCSSGNQKRTIRGWSFFGTFDRFDFSNVSFLQCRFVDVSFRSCAADESTHFEDCVFSGDLEIASSSRSGWAAVRVADCRLSFPTDVVWEEVLGRNLGSKKDQMLKVLRAAMGRFWYHGRPRISMRLDDWNKGILGNLGLSRRVLDVMLKVGLVRRITISGVSEGGIAFDKSSMRDLQSYMDNQQLQGKIKEVFEVLVNDL